MPLARPRPRQAPPDLGTAPHAPRLGGPATTAPRLGPTIRRVHFELGPGQNVIGQSVGFARWLSVVAALDTSSGASPNCCDAFWLKIDDGDAFKIAVGMFVALENGFGKLSVGMSATTYDGTAISEPGAVDFLIGENLGDGVIVSGPGVASTYAARRIPGAQAPPF